METQIKLFKPEEVERYKYMQKYSNIFYKYCEDLEAWIVSDEEYPLLSGTIFMYHNEHYRIDKAIDHFKNMIDDK